MTPTAAQAPLPLAGIKPALVLGIDPGSIKCGWGALRRDARGRLQHVRSGTIEAKGPPMERLAAIHDAVARLVLKLAPDVVAVEDVFVGVDPKAALMVGQARGAVLSAVGRARAALGRNRMPLQAYKASTTKKELTGNGRAEKELVARAVQAQLRLAKQPQEDEADALAAAITAARRWRT